MNMNNKWIYNFGFSVDIDKMILKNKFHKIFNMHGALIFTFNMIFMLLLIGFTICLILKKTLNVRDIKIKDFETSNFCHTIDSSVDFTRQSYLYMNNIYLIFKHQPLFFSKNLTADDMWAEMKILTSDYLQKANKFGFTDIMIPESSINIFNGESTNVLRELTKNSASYNIKITLLLDEQFSVSFHKHFINPEVFLTNGNNYPIIIYDRYVFNQTSSAYHILIKNKLEYYVSLGIKSFCIGENPYILTLNSHNENRRNKKNEINYPLLSKRSNFILNMAQNITLLYRFKHDTDMQKIRLIGLKYQIYVFDVDWNFIYRLLFYFETMYKDEIYLFTKTFQSYQKENKVIFLNIRLFEKQFSYWKILFGIYLFSPVPIILLSEDQYPYNFFNNIFFPNNKRIYKFFSENYAFKTVISIKNNHPFFRLKSRLLGYIEYKDGIFTGIRKSTNSIKPELIFFLYNKKDENDEVNIYNIFHNYSFNNYSILYDGSITHMPAIDNGRGVIKLIQKHILIIKPHMEY